MPSRNWPREVEQELAHAIEARRQGNEGRARVCARRAAGFAARAYLKRRGSLVGSHSVLDVLGRLAVEPGIDAGLRDLIDTLELRVDSDFKLPQGVDLMAVAEDLCRRLLN